MMTSDTTGFYERKILADDLIEEARKVAGIDEEIAMMRARIKKHGDDHPEDLAVIIRGTRLLVQAVSARYRMNPAVTAEFSDSFTELLRSLSDQLLPSTQPQ